MAKRKNYARTFGQDLMRGEHVVGGGNRQMTHTIKISAKMARLPFNGCEVDYINNICHARCCESSTSPTGTLITIHPTEIKAIELRGGRVVNGLLQPSPGQKKCPFKTDTNLCGLHNTSDKPFGCIASPFTLNKNKTLIVRNRYKLLKCYNDGRRIPAYKAFAASLVLILGAEQAQKVTQHFDSGGGDVNAIITDRVYKMLTENDEIKHQLKADSTSEKQAHFVSGTLFTSDSGNDPAYYFKKQEVERRLGRELTTAEFQELYYTGPDTYTSGTSIFDPVLCELVYTWFSSPGAAVLDPFAGGSVRGIVAAYLGRKYTGIDLRQEQIDANVAQAVDIFANADRASFDIPHWIAGDSTEMDDLLPEGEQYDLIFSCPPYADLEVYSDDPRDISTMDYPDFLRVYRDIIARSVTRLRDDRFACFVVGEVRGKDGNYYNFVGDTVQAFIDAGCAYYNEAILVTAVGSLPIRAGKQFAAGRKLGKTHQNVLVFVKGDARRAADWCGEVDVMDILELGSEALEDEA